MFCSISGQVPEDPVVSSKSGHLFERRLIEKYLDSEGVCPITKGEMVKDDLISIQGNKAVKPRPVTATSVPGLLSLFQNEWDSLMLESFQLKQHLDTVRQELSQALYQHDAACRVIARVTRERDEARAALSGAQARAAQGVAGGPQTADVEMEAAPVDEIPESVISNITALSKKLSKGRKKRAMPEGLASKENIQNWQPKSSFTHHLSSSPGILCVDIHPDQNQVLTGGVDKTVKLFDRSAGKVTASLAGHAKKVNSALFIPKHNSLVSASADKTVKLWSQDGDSYSCAATLDHHTADVVGVTMQASGDYAVSASADGSWAFLDVATASVLRHVKDNSVGAMSCVSLHPDGLILGTGTMDNVIRIWDVTSQQNVATCEGHTGAVNDVCFSENGYYMASASADGSVKLWDLRRLKNFRNLDADGPVHSVHFDYSGSYLAAAGQDIRVYATKSWDGLTTLAAHTSDVTSVRFGAAASFLVSTSLDRSMKFYN